MESNKENIVFKKVPISVLLEILHNAWNMGADYVDISGVPDEEQDDITIFIKNEYFHTEKQTDSDQITSFETLPEDDLNKLI